MDWALAGAIVGSVATICLTILKILEIWHDKKIKSDNDCIKENCTDLEVLKAEVENLKEDLHHLHTHFDTLNDTIIKLLTENYRED